MNGVVPDVTPRKFELTLSNIIHSSLDKATNIPGSTFEIAEESLNLEL